MYKVRLIVFVAVVSTMFIYWWRTDRSHVRAPIPSAAIAVGTGEPASIARTTGSVGAGTNGTGSPSPDANATTATGTSGAPAAPAGDANAPSSRSTGAPAERPAPSRAGRAPARGVTRGSAAAAGAGAARVARPSSPDTRSASAGYGGLEGTARDASGGVLPGVRVQASKAGLFAKTWNATTDRAGHYTFNGLPEGTYTVTFDDGRRARVKREAVVPPGRIVQGVDGVWSTR